MIFDFKSLIPKGKYPMLNETFESIITGIKDQPTQYPDIDKWIIKTPEAMAIITAIVTDIMSDGFKFRPIAEKSSGKQFVKNANDFSDENMFKEELEAFLFDWLIYGDAYLWKGGLKKAQKVQEIVDKAKSILKANEAEYKSKGIDLNTYFDFKSLDEDALKKVRHMAATTITIRHDKYKITHFTQLVNSPNEEVKFEVDEVIHAKLIPLKGKVYGWSPIMALLPEMQGIAYVKDFSNTWFRDGGVPDWFFIMEKEMAGSANHKALQVALQKYRDPRAKHGNLVFTGQVEAINMNKDGRDMEYRLLAIYYTGVLALAFNMPISRVASILGSEVKASSAGSEDATTDGYWKSIKRKQDYLETLLNQQLFRPFFKVEIKFNRAYLQDELREIQVEQMKLGNIQAARSLGIKYTNEYIMSKLDLDEEDVDEIDLDKAMEQQQIEMQQQQLKNQDLMRGQATQAYSKEKKKTANNRGAKSFLVESLPDGKVKIVEKVRE